MRLLDFGLTSYRDAWEWQKAFVAARAAGGITSDWLALLEHPPVITVGRSGTYGHILAGGDYLRRQGIDTYHVDRGGDVTYHGPGQLVVYPLLDLTRYGRDVHAYVDRLEEVVIRTLADFGLAAGRDPRYTGVWVGLDKICAIGIGIRRWFTYHGLALNVSTNLDPFGLIVPCGISDRGVTSMARLLGASPDMPEVRSRLVHHFGAVFGVTVCGSDNALWPEGWSGLDGGRPPWLMARVSAAASVGRMHDVLTDLALHTVCAGAQCPNQGECFAAGTATFMILGTTCTRNCRFCAVPKGRPVPVDEDEPQRIAEAVQRLGLKYAVITSVTRDDLPEGGAAHFARTIRTIRTRVPGAKIEVLVPDFQGDAAALNMIIAASPDVLNHNIETVPDLYDAVRPGADYRRSLNLLGRVKQTAPDITTKSGLMAGLGETPVQVATVLADLRSAGCDMVTIGQYLAPSADHVPVKEYITPAQFAFHQRLAEALGFRHAACGPLVRSSYHAAGATEASLL
jgi:lipoic acid synthetase